MLSVSPSSIPAPLYHSPHFHNPLLHSISLQLQSPKPTHASKLPNSTHGSSSSSGHFKCNSNSYNSNIVLSSLELSTFSETSDAEVSGSGALDQWVNPDLLADLLQSCHRLKDIRIIHSAVVKRICYPVVIVNNNLINCYINFGKLIEARKVFDVMSERSVVSWTAMLNGYLKHGMDDEALWFLDELLKSGIRPNEKTFVCMLNLCSKSLDHELGKQIHAGIIKGGCHNGNLIVDSAIVYFYLQFGDFTGAFKVFNKMQERDVVCWTTMITACSQQGLGKQAFSMLKDMLIDGLSPNEHTVCSVLKACGEEKELMFGRQLHGVVVKKLIRNDVFIDTSLVGMYGRCGQIGDARKVFDKMRKRNMVTWTSIISAYARSGLGYEAINIFRAMKRRKVVVNNITILSVLRACGSIGSLCTGKEVHAQVVKNSIQSNIYIASTLVWLYCKCGEYALASKILQRMPLRDVVSWTAIISGHARVGCEFEALEFLKEMLGEGVEPNPFTYSSILKACAELEDIQQGKSIHSSVNKTPAFSNVFVGSALINMYAKCGYVSEAFQVFDCMPERNLVSWRAMIIGYAKNGHCHEALQLMYRMQAEGFEVDDYVLATVLTACGDIEWNPVPTTKHCLQPS